jgi:hypothetical protein
MCMGVLLPALVARAVAKFRYVLKDRSPTPYPPCKRRTSPNLVRTWTRQKVAKESGHQELIPSTLGELLMSARSSYPNRSGYCR